MLQMAVLEPRLAILDEIDSGLDIDALKDVASAIGEAYHSAQMYARANGPGTPRTINVRCGHSVVSRPRFGKKH